MPPPYRMALSTIWLRLQREGEEQPIDPTYGNKTRARDDQHEPEIELLGQPRFVRHDALSPRTSGDSPNTLGHVTFSYDVLEEAEIAEERLEHALIVGYERRGERVDEEYQVTRVDPGGHLMGGPIFVMAYVEKYRDKRGAT